MLQTQHIYVIIVVIKNQALGESLNMKKLLSFCFVLSLTCAYTVPVLAIENTVLNASTEQSVNKNKKKNTKILPNKNKYEYVNLGWWQKFNDENLNKYIVKAIENNLDLKTATLTIDEYYQNIAIQRSSELPSLQAGFMPGYSKIMGPSSGGFGLPIIANYELDLFGKNHNKTTSMRKLYEASILDEQSAYISIVSAVGTVYLNIVKLDAMIDLQEDIVKLRKEIFEMMSISNAEGLASTSDLMKSNQAYIEGVASLTDLKKERTKLLHQLAVLTGDSPNNIEDYVRSDYRSITFSGAVPESISSDIIMNRPDYKKAEKLMEKAGIDVRVARKEMLPSLSLGGGVFFNTKHLESLFTTSNMLWGFGGSIMQPLFMGGKLKANLKSKKIAYEKSLKNYEKVNLTSMQEVNDSLVSAQLDKEKLIRQKKIKELEEKDYKLSELKYQQGVIAKLDLNQREENLLNVSKMVYETEYNCMIDYISVYKAVAAQNI